MIWPYYLPSATPTLTQLEPKTTLKNTTSAKQLLKLTSKASVAKSKALVNAS